MTQENLIFSENTTNSNNLQLTKRTLDSLLNFTAENNNELQVINKDLVSQNITSFFIEKQKEKIEKEKLEIAKSNSFFKSSPSGLIDPNREIGLLEGTGTFLSFFLPIPVIGPVSVGKFTERVGAETAINAIAEYVPLEVERQVTKFKNEVSVAVSREREANEIKFTEMGEEIFELSKKVKEQEEEINSYTQSEINRQNELQERKRREQLYRQRLIERNIEEPEIMDEPNLVNEENFLIQSLQRQLDSARGEVQRLEEERQNLITQRDGIIERGINELNDKSVEILKQDGIIRQHENEIQALKIWINHSLTKIKNATGRSFKEDGEIGYKIIEEATDYLCSINKVSYTKQFQNWIADKSGMNYLGRIVFYSLIAGGLFGFSWFTSFVWRKLFYQADIKLINRLEKDLESSKSDLGNSESKIINLNLENDRLERKLKEAKEEIKDLENKLSSRKKK